MERYGPNGEYLEFDAGFFNADAMIELKDNDDGIRGWCFKANLHSYYYELASREGQWAYEQTKAQAESDTRGAPTVKIGIKACTGPRGPCGFLKYLLPPTSNAGLWKHPVQECLRSACFPLGMLHTLRTAIWSGLVGDDAGNWAWDNGRRILFGLHDRVEYFYEGSNSVSGYWLALPKGALRFARHYHALQLLSGSPFPGRSEVTWTGLTVRTYCPVRSQPKDSRTGEQRSGSDMQNLDCLYNRWRCL
jgi:hypothetical protein